MNKADINKRFDELSEILLNEMDPRGFWPGRLSSSALGVAVATAALHFHDKNVHSNEIRLGLKWLQNHINHDGSFGDTPESFGNVSTSLLVYATANLYSSSDKNMALLQEKIAGYLKKEEIDVRSMQVLNSILNHYGKDYTFSVPILTMCGLCGVPGPEAFKHIPQLPFELSLLPNRLYKILNLSVVSYAIPALIAVGIVVFSKKKSGFLLRLFRKHSVKRSLKLLEEMMPSSGGFLEAMPLTAFVCLSLTEAGYKDLKTVEKGIHFLKNTQRSDGSWPIDIDLSTWLTTLSVKALTAKKDAFTKEIKDNVAAHLLNNQNKKVHPFNKSNPGGWGWTHFPGAVPDGDDTSGVIVSLLKLKKPNEIKPEIITGCDWLVELQNRDGGIPTFSKGWGKLPFDKSCADVTGHAFLAISSCLNSYHGEIDFATEKRYNRFLKTALVYLEKYQHKNGSWLPLWFGNQNTPDHTNPVYGTSRIVAYLRETSTHKWKEKTTREKISRLADKGEEFLVSVQNPDGSWGGNLNIPGTIEETALAVSAISSKYRNERINGLIWIDKYYSQNGLKSAPIGLYFASLWYDEKLYPLTAWLEALSKNLDY